MNEHESKPDQGINTAEAEVGEEKLEGYAHRHCAWQRVRGIPLSRADVTVHEIGRLGE